MTGNTSRLKDGFRHLPGTYTKRCMTYAPSCNVPVSHGQNLWFPQLDMGSECVPLHGGISRDPSCPSVKLQNRPWVLLHPQPVLPDPSFLSWLKVPEKLAGSYDQGEVHVATNKRKRSTEATKFGGLGAS